MRDLVCVRVCLRLMVHQREPLRFFTSFFFFLSLSRFCIFVFDREHSKKRKIKK